MCFRPPQVKKKIIRCPKCGFMVNEGDKQCKKCGADLTQKPALKISCVKKTKIKQAPLHQRNKKGDEKGIKGNIKKENEIKTE